MASPLSLSPPHALSLISTFCLSRANLLTWVTLYMAIFAIIQLATNYVPSLTTVALIFLGTLAGMLTTLSVRPHSSCNCGAWCRVTIHTRLLFAAAPPSSLLSTGHALCGSARSGRGTVGKSFLGKTQWLHTRQFTVSMRTIRLLSKNMNLIMIPFQILCDDWPVCPLLRVRVDLSA